MTPPVLTPALLEDIRSRADRLGFDLAGATPAAISERDRLAYVSWCETGGAATMGYMTRDPERRLDPTRAFPGAKSLLTFGVSYYQGDPPPKPGPAYGRVARYAWGADYHDVIEARLRELIASLHDLLGADCQASPAVDARPLLERAVAEAGGLGFMGKNTVLIASGADGRFHVGSWLFLAEIVLNVPIQETASSGAPAPSGCGGCTRCLTACPTDALQPYRLSSDRCLSYLTIENKGRIPPPLRASMGDWIFGCDICQEVCPFNARALEARWPELRASRGAGPWISLREVLGMDARQFKTRFAGSPLLRPKRRGLVRNACVAAGNSGAEELAAPLRALTADEEPVVRSHALWGLSRLDAAAARASAESLRKDPDPEVRREAMLILETAEAPS